MEACVCRQRGSLWPGPGEQPDTHQTHTHCHKQSGYGQGYEQRNPCIAIYTITTSYTNPEGQLHSTGSVHFHKALTHTKKSSN